jgi:hypothetical protein
MSRTPKEPTKLVNFRAPAGLLTAARRASRRADLDLSKFIRSAIREKARRHGIVADHVEN